MRPLDDRILHGMSGSSAMGRFVGRALELDVLERALHQASGGAGSLIVVGGEAGIGKSRLLEEVAERAWQRGTAVLRGRGVPHGGPFRPVVEALVPVAPPALADLERLAPYRSVLGTLLPGWPPDTKAAE